MTPPIGSVKRGEAVFGTGELSTALAISSEWVIRRPGSRRAGRTRTRTGLARSR
jgi:hypothetical protein